MNETRLGGELHFIDDGQTIEIVDGLVDGWILRYELAEDCGRWGGSAAEAALATALTASLGQQLPGLMHALSQRSALAAATNTPLQVSFSADVRRLIATGQYSLDTTTGALPVARDQLGRFTEFGRFTPNTAIAGAELAAAPLIAVAWPFMLAIALSAAASWAQQRWLDQTFSALSASLDLIETRLRDDDFGVLEAADALVANCRTAGGICLPSQLRSELAVMRPRVDAIYRSRRRYVQRLKLNIEKQQLEDEAKGKRGPWAPDVADRLTKDGVVEELVVFLEAMSVNARLNALTASVLADDGEPAASLRLLDSLEATIRRDYHDLHNRLAALATHAPALGVVARFTERRETDRARELVGTLTSSMERTIGSQLPDRDAIVSLALVPEAA